jgi:glycerophosphoryl diester phosphodiesterase
VLTSPVAHRGLHGEGVGENTFTAYQRAIDNGYPIEMDVQLTSDGVPVCFHDDNLVRVTGENALIWDKTYEQIKHLKISGTNDGIPLFSEFLSFVNGKVPLMIEIKKQKNGN